MGSLARLLACAFALAGCARASAPRATVEEPAPVDAKSPLQPLHDFEEAKRAATDFATLAPSHDAFGPDPYVVRRLPSPSPAAGAARFVGILRGRAALVALDAELHEIQRVAAPDAPSALAVSDAGDVYVASELGHAIATYRFDRGALVAGGAIDLGDVRAVRDLAVGPEGTIHVVEEERGRLVTLSRSGRDERVVGHGPIRVVRTKHHVVVDCLLDHAVVALEVDAEGRPRAEMAAEARHDGPMWSIDAAETQEGLWIAAGGVEDHPLDRTGGFFGYVDSFVFTYRKEGAALVRAAAVNVSQEGVVTPKSIAWLDAPRALEVTGYGGDAMATLRWSAPGAAPAITRRDLPPGSNAVAPFPGGLAIANPLLDAWVLAGDGAAPRIVAVADDRPRSDASKVGEALFYTKLMAPWNRSDGALSRFTCETCHFEAYVDGRTHHTGRGDVHATTKPLVGLFNNRPHFSRALDPDMTTMVNNEFRVAGAHSDHDPSFSIATSDFPWLAEMHVEKTRFSAEELRRALMTYLMELTHRPSPRALEHLRFDEDERAGALLFRERCEKCHAARTASDEPRSRVPFDEWEEHVLAPVGRAGGGIVWGSSEYQRTGVEPYVHPLGARTPSLRRLGKKWPYFTNGRAKSVEDVLDRARFSGGQFLHDGAPPAGGSPLRALDPRERAALLAFLALL